MRLSITSVVVNLLCFSLWFLAVDADTITTLDGADGDLNKPGSVRVDASGDLYFADSSNNRILKLTISTGVTTTVAGSTTSGYSGDGGLATNATLYIPGGIALDTSGNIYVADTFNHVIRMITVSSGIITTVAGTGTSGNSGDGGLATEAMMDSPQGVFVDTSGNIYIAESANIRQVTDGIITTIAGTGTFGFSGDGGPATEAMLDQPRNVLVVGSNIYIADSGNNRYRVINSANGAISTVVGSGCSGLRCDTVDSGFSGDGGAATDAKLSFPIGGSVDAAGDFYVTDTLNHRVRKITLASGNISTVAGSGEEGFSGDGGDALSAKLDMPFDAVASTVDGVSVVYIADTSNSRIRLLSIVDATSAPSSSPAPSASPTPAPTTVDQTSKPSNPTLAPTVVPTAVPTMKPTAPTVAPSSAIPTMTPTGVPSVKPSTFSPTAVPTEVPTVAPSSAGDPTASPTMVAVLKVEQNFKFATFPDETDLVAVDTFKKSIQSSVASALNVSASDVTIVKLAKSSSLRSRSLVSVSIDCEYTIKVSESAGSDTTATVAALSTSLATASSDGSLQTSLASNGVTADTVETAVTTDTSPTAAPNNGPSAFPTMSSGSFCRPHWLVSASLLSVLVTQLL